MSNNLYQDKIRDIRFKYVDRKQERKADLFMGLWLELKISVTQNQSKRVIIKQEKRLNEFFSKKEILAMLEENKEIAQKALYLEILDSALIYQKACLEDRNYGSKFLNLIRMKDDEIAYKAAKEVYQIIIPALMSMDNRFWRNQMITALHVAYQEIFAKEAFKPEILFDAADLQLNEELNNILMSTLKNEGAE
ncbi:MAG: hypothetical protein GX328_00705 [Clostridiaceae bacterium]|nr:hypothetical protein [Clostridiaceae bacterium]